MIILIRRQHCTEFHSRNRQSLFSRYLSRNGFH
nr:MAG TPA_asm: hypothetical protein [Bacteriophage sp.]